MRYVQRPLPSRHALSARSKQSVPGCRLFEHDEEVRQAIGEVPQNHVVGAPRPEGGGGGGAGGSGSMDPMVLRALSVFERNVAMYVQRPDRCRPYQSL